MNEIAQQSIKERLLHALDAEGLNKTTAAMWLGVKAQYLSGVTTQNSFVPEDVWKTLQHWTNSGLTIKEFGRHKEANIPIIAKIEVGHVQDNSVADIMLGSAKVIELDAKSYNNILMRQEREYSKKRLEAIIPFFIESFQQRKAIPIQWFQEYNNCIESINITIE